MVGMIGSQAWKLFGITGTGHVLSKNGTCYSWLAPEYSKTVSFIFPCLKVYALDDFQDNIVMEIKLTQFSIVVVVADHNPTILNPDFLKIQKIVPGDWVLAGPAITTPPFATVPYENGVSVSVEPSKLQVADNKSPDPSQSSIVSVVAKEQKLNNLSAILSTLFNFCSLLR